MFNILQKLDFMQNKVEINFEIKVNLQMYVC